MLVIVVEMVEIVVVLVMVVVVMVGVVAVVEEVLSSRGRAFEMRRGSCGSSIVCFHNLYYYLIFYFSIF